MNTSQIISVAKKYDGRGWGGYRIAIDRFLPKGGGHELEMFISKYYGITYPGIAGLGLVSLAFGTGTYFGVLRLAKRTGALQQ